jgi:hypothetical protein
MTGGASANSVEMDRDLTNVGTMLGCALVLRFRFGLKRLCSFCFSFFALLAPGTK